MNARLVALDDGPDIDLNQAMVVVGRHPACDARLDSLRVSRHHCCMTHTNGELLIRDLGSTNGIRINGQRVEIGRLKPGDELSIAHIRYRLDDGSGHDKTLADSSSDPIRDVREPAEVMVRNGGRPTYRPDENALAAAVRKILPPSVASRCRIQVIVRMDDDDEPPHPTPVGMSSSQGQGASE
ncbi:FHA domain-containing protein [Paludisphaera rhizosphaerae]|uniref:FHA domain-containing protein n=1 Tax=Paludisphaera rhizosphaerae TaxID=2711216 RepID=UPI0013EC63B9|nr:FHA domain-containing protein [Paludisphaera rhizosphaerae]